MLPYIIPDVSNLRQDRDYNSLLPDYEEAVLKQPPPPSYSVAVANGYAATIILPPENMVSPSTSRHLETANVPPPPAYSTLQRNSIISDIAEEANESSSSTNEAQSEPQSPISQTPTTENTEISDTNQSQSAQQENNETNTPKDQPNQSTETNTNEGDTQQNK